MIPIDEYHLVTYETYDGSHVIPPVHPLLWRHVSHHHSRPFEQIYIFQCQMNISTTSISWLDSFYNILLPKMSNCLPVSLKIAKPYLSIFSTPSSASNEITHLILLFSSFPSHYSLQTIINISSHYRYQIRRLAITL